MKKGIYIIILGIWLAVLFTGCGSDKDKPFDSDITESIGKQETGSTAERSSTEQQTQNGTQESHFQEEASENEEMSEAPEPSQAEEPQPEVPQPEPPQPEPVQPEPQQPEPPQPENPPQESTDAKELFEGNFLKEKGKESLGLQNERRAQAGLAPLSWDEELYQCILVRGPEIVQSFSHTRPDGSDCFSVVTVSYWTVGENIAYGYPSAAAVTEGWYNSEGHRRNMLNPGFTSAAVVCYEYNRILYWVTMFRG